MRTILIAPDLADKGLMVQDLETEDSLQAIYKRLDCELIDTIRLDERGNVMYVDDEGYMTKDYFFAFGQYPMPIAGRGLIVGTDLSTGESIDTNLNITVIENLVVPLDARGAYEMARLQDQLNLERIGDNPNHIYVRVAEIMESAWYADQLELET